MIVRLLGRRWVLSTLAIGLSLFAAAAWTTAELMRRPRLYADPIREHETPARFGWAYEDVAVAAPDGQILRGWFIPEPRSAGRTVILLHGICANKGAMLGWAEIVRSACRANVCVMDLRGHGTSGGDSISYGLVEKHDVRAVFDHLAARPDVDRREIAVAGTSLGAASRCRRRRRTRGSAR